MPGKNKPKRLNRQRSWRVARRKKRIAKLVGGGSRNRAPRPKNKKSLTEKVVAVVKKVVSKKEVKKVMKK
ncbi:hypothetical protein HN903_04900 [archaeon]|jgi:hypothetical protein|nr:hypothetical protein [archaeon]MBT7129066.1 hypothetical protein [archaeon]